MRKVRDGDIVQFPIARSIYAYGRIYCDGSYGVYEFVSNKCPKDISIITSNRISLYYDVAEYRSKSGEWPKVGVDPFTSDESRFIPPYLIEDKQCPGRFRVVENGTERPSNEEDSDLAVGKRFDDEGMIIDVRHELDGVVIWPTDEIFNPDHYPPVALLSQAMLGGDSVYSLNEVNVSLALASLDDNIMMPAVRAVRNLIKQLSRNCSGSVSRAEQLAFFERCVERINELQSKVGVIETSDRETLLELLYSIGEVCGIQREANYIDQWRSW